MNGPKTRISPHHLNTTSISAATAHRTEVRPSRCFDKRPVERRGMVIAEAYYGNRAIIEQATGHLMGLGGLTAGQAFEHISQRSQDTNRKVIAILQATIDRAGQLSVSYQPRFRTEVLLDLVYPPQPDASQPRLNRRFPCEYLWSLTHL